MKKLTLALLFSAFTLVTMAQPSATDAELAKSSEITGAGTFFKPKLIYSLTKLGLAQLSVGFKQVSTKSVTKREKKPGVFGGQPGKAATGSVSAYLNITDDELTDADYQEITDHFYNYFQKVLKQNNIDTVAWSTIANAEFFKDGKEANAKDEDKEQAVVYYNANNGNSMYNGKTGFAFGKIKKAARFCEEIGAPAAFIYTTVDFADILVDVEVKTTGYKSTWTPSYNTVGQVTKSKSKTSVAAFMKIPAYSGSSLFYNEKSATELFTVIKDIPAEMNYADELTEDPSLLKKRSKLFSVSFSKKLESTPVVISSTKLQYKNAAKKALERYADALVAKSKG